MNSIFLLNALYLQLA